MTPEQERAEIRKALESKEAKYLCECAFANAPTWLRNSLDREEQLKQEISSQVTELLETEKDLFIARAKVAEKDKEIQRLEGIQELWKGINPTVYQMFELISSLYQSYLLDSKQSGVTDPVNIEQWFENLSQFKANSSNQS